MMKPALFIVVSCCLSLHAASQQNGKRLSSLRDSIHVQELIHNAKGYEKTNRDSALHYYESATSLAFSIKNVPLLISSMSQHMQLINYDGDFEKGLGLAQQHLTMANKLNNPSLQLVALNEMANEHEYLGDYEPATDYYLKSLQIANRIGNKIMQRRINNNLGSVFLGLKNYAIGYTYSSRAYEMAREAKDTVTMGNCLVNMGIAELNQKKYQRSLSDFDEAEKIGYDIPDMTLVADALSDKGLVYLTTHDLTAATASYTKQKSIADKYDLPYEKLYSLFQLAMVEKEKGNIKNANDFASSAISIGEKLGTDDELMEMYDSMSSIKQKMGDYQSALVYKNKYITKSDSLRNQQVQTNIHHLNIQYRSAQKDKEIAEQNLSIQMSKAAIERKNNWIFISLAGIIALASILILSLRNYHNKKKLHEQHLLTLEKKHQLSTLEAKMQAREEERNRIAREMHDDIGSALTSILYLSDDLKTGNEENQGYAADRIGVTASAVVDKMNEIIWSMNPEYDSLNDLIAYIRQHCAEFLGDYGLNYSLNAPETMNDLPLSGEQRRNIYLVIKEALHNIVKHAAATDVSINLRVAENYLTVFIRDNGKGFNQPSAFGNGLKNMQHRIETIGGRFNISRDNGTIIELMCPLSTAQAS